MMVSGLTANVFGDIERQKRQALAVGDIRELMRLNRLVFNGFRMMADDDEDEDKEEEEGTGSAGDDDSSDDEGTKDTSGDEEGATVSKAKYDELLNRMKATDRRASKAEEAARRAEKAEQDRERKEKSDLENAQSDLQTANETIAELRSELGTMRLDNAFLAANTITWHNPSAAMKLAQSEGFLEEVADDEGNVDTAKLKSALQKLAKEHQYLVKKRGEDGGGSGSSGESGGTRSRNKDDKDAKDREDARRAPQLNRRSRVSVGEQRR